MIYIYGNIEWNDNIEIKDTDKNKYIPNIYQPIHRRVLPKRALQITNIYFSIFYKETIIREVFLPIEVFDAFWIIRENIKHLKG